MATSSKAATGENGHKLVSLDELRTMPLPYEDVDVPEYGDGYQIRLHAVSGARRAELADLNTDESAGGRLRFVHDLIAASLGNGATPETVADLPSAVVDRLSRAALRLTGIGQENEIAESLGEAQNADAG